MNDSQKKFDPDPKTSGEKVSMSKDASCQTSDCELFSNRKSEDMKNNVSNNNNKQRRHYSDHRRATDSLLQGSRKEGNRSLVN